MGGLTSLSANFIMIVLSCGIVLSSVPAPAGQESKPVHHDWKVYTNTRFGYAICIPQDLLVPQGESDAGDGQTFLAKDGAKLIVFGHRNVLNESLKTWVDGTVRGIAVRSESRKYTAIKPNLYVVSGLNGSTVFYARAIARAGTFKEFLLTYNASQAGIYEPVVKEIATKCFVNTDPPSISSLRK